jgi:hypothetical protein
MKSAQVQQEIGPTTGSPSVESRHQVGSTGQDGGSAPSLAEDRASLAKVGGTRKPLI